MLQFDLEPRHRRRRARRAGGDQRRAQRSCRPSLPSNPTYRKVNPADAPIMILALTSDTLTQGQMYDAASTILAQKLVAGRGRRPGDRRRQLAAGGARRAESARAEQVRHRLRGGARGDRRDQRQPARRASSRTATGTGRSTPTTRRRPRAEYLPLIVAYRNGARGAPDRRRPRSSTRCRTCATPARPTASRRCC